MPARFVLAAACNLQEGFRGASNRLSDDLQRFCSLTLSRELTSGFATSDGARRGPQKKHKPTKAELLEAAKAKAEAVKALEGTKEGRVCGPLHH